MAAYLKNGKGNTGSLHNPADRARQLRRYAHLTLEEAGRKMGVGRERARHLYHIYGINRERRTKKTNLRPAQPRSGVPGTRVGSARNRAGVERRRRLDRNG